MLQRDPERTLTEMALTILEIKNAKLGMHTDGGGLDQYVKGGGTKSWIFRYQIRGRRREMGLGSLASLSPVSARAEAARLKAMLRSISEKSSGPFSATR